MSKNTSLSDRSTRYSPDDPGGPGTPIQGPPLLLEGAAVWERYKWPVVGVVTLLLLALLGSELYRGSQHRKMEAASAALDGSKTISEYQQVVDKYPGTLAAANAYLLLAREQIEAKDFAAAAATWQTFTEKFPKHPQVAAALLARGNALEAQGKLDEARSLYQQVASAHASDYVAPAALLAEARLLESQRKTEDARRVYENLIASHQDSVAAAQAQQALQLLNSLPPLGAPPPTPAPSPSPVASSPPVAPAVPPPARVEPTAASAATALPVSSPSTSPSNP